MSGAAGARGLPVAPEALLRQQHVQRDRLADLQQMPGDRARPSAPRAGCRATPGSRPECRTTPAPRRATAAVGCAGPSACGSARWARRRPGLAIGPLPLCPAQSVVAAGFRSWLHRSRHVTGCGAGFRSRRRVQQYGAGKKPSPTLRGAPPLVLSVLLTDHREHQIPGVADVDNRQ
jgi:hypothetical protein